MCSNPTHAGRVHRDWHDSSGSCVTRGFTSGNLATQAIQIKRKEVTSKEGNPEGGAAKDEKQAQLDIEAAIAAKLHEEALKAEFERKKQKVLCSGVCVYVCVCVAGRGGREHGMQQRSWS